MKFQRMSKWFQSCLQIGFPNIFEMTGRMMIGLKLLFCFLKPCLKPGVMLANLRCWKFWNTYSFVYLQGSISAKHLALSFNIFLNWDVCIVPWFVIWFSDFFNNGIFINLREIKTWKTPNNSYAWMVVIFECSF